MKRFQCLDIFAAVALIFLGSEAARADVRYSCPPTSTYTITGQFRHPSTNAVLSSKSGTASMGLANTEYTKGVMYCRYQPMAIGASWPVSVTGADNRLVVIKGTGASCFASQGTLQAGSGTKTTNGGSAVSVKFQPEGVNPSKDQRSRTFRISSSTKIQASGTCTSDIYFGPTTQKLSLAGCSLITSGGKKFVSCGK